ncbi:unnamed protein product [Prunus armeniaca]|uniref:Uncharacterized protein n=1 Tax=Prunus armeniaca TaxID=36596 RepID=A0A6J5XSK9_PRUAR|nr:hypothetical protein GBA52_020030 [Prunus armeniaca]CAB4314158.1 unnamed protein product [Prunus armeniaca]
MSVSLEALAMAGTDYRSIAMTVEEWERCDLDLSPPHLLAEDEEEKDERKLRKGEEEEISQRPFPADPAIRRL